MRKEKGSALIIAMLLIAAVGAIAFGIGKLLFLEVGTEQINENGSIAYYAAASGIEEGLLRYRYDTKAQVPTSSWKLGSANVFRTDLTGSSTDTGASSVGIPLTNTIATTSANKQYYDLRMGYLGTDGNPWYGHLTGLGGQPFLSNGDLEAPSYSTGDYSVLDIQKDDSLKIDLSGLKNIGLSTDRLQLAIRYEGIANPYVESVDPLAGPLMEITFTYDPLMPDGSGVKQYKSLLTDNLTYCSGIPALSEQSVGKLLCSRMPMVQTTAGYRYVELWNLAADVFNDAGAPIPNSGSMSLTLKPLNYSASIGLMKAACQHTTDTTSSGGSCNSSDSAIAGPFTTISSTGYYGGVTRKLVANIDRQSGTLYDLFDYVINKNN